MGDLLCTAGRVDQSANTTESLAQLTSSIERKRNTLKSLLRRELQALESDAVLLNKKNKKRKNLLTKEQEAQLAARLFARSQVCRCSSGHAFHRRVHVPMLDARVRCVVL